MCGGGHTHIPTWPMSQIIREKLKSSVTYTVGLTVRDNNMYSRIDGS